jgi:hypothetical protein
MGSPAHGERRKPLLTEAEAAAELGVSVRTLQTWRYLSRRRETHRGPPWVQLGRGVRYERVELARYMDAAFRGGAAVGGLPGGAASASAPREGEAA